MRRPRQAAALAARRSRARRRANCRCDTSRRSLPGSLRRPSPRSPCRCHRCARCHPSQLHGSRHRAGRCQRQKPHPWPRQRTQAKSRQARPLTDRSTAWDHTHPLSTKCSTQRAHPLPTQCSTQRGPPLSTLCSTQRAQPLFGRRSRRSARSSEPRSTRRSSLEWTCAPPAHFAARHRQARHPAPRCAAAAALKPTLVNRSYLGRPWPAPVPLLPQPTRPHPPPQPPPEPPYAWRPAASRRHPRRAKLRHPPRAALTTACHYLPGCRSRATRGRGAPARHGCSPRCGCSRRRGCCLPGARPHRSLLPPSLLGSHRAFGGSSSDSRRLLRLSFVRW